MSGSDTDTNTLAVISAVAGAASWVALPTIAAVVAIVCGHMARARIARSGGSSSDAQLALVGLILGWANILLSCLVIGFVVLVFVGAIGVAGFGAAHGG